MCEMLGMSANVVAWTMQRLREIDLSTGEKNYGCEMVRRATKHVFQLENIANFSELNSAKMSRWFLPQIGSPLCDSAVAAVLLLSSSDRDDASRTSS